MNTKSLLALAVVYSVASTALAYSSGAAGYSKQGCNGGCHSGGTTPTVALGGPSTLAAGASGAFTLTISGASSSCTGIDVSTSAGSLAVSGSDGPSEQMSLFPSGEVVNSSAASFSGSSQVYTFHATAPSSGTFTLYAAGLLGCSKGSSGSKTTSMTVTVQAGAGPPTVATPASASPNTVNTGVSTQLSVLGASPAGETSLTLHLGCEPKHRRDVRLEWHQRGESDDRDLRQRRELPAHRDPQGREQPDRHQQHERDGQ